MSSSSSSAGDSSRASSPVSAPAKRKRADDASDSSVSEGEDSPEVPVLSHKEKRRQKKSQQSTVEKPPIKKAKVDESRKRQNSVWVGNLSFKTTEASLRQFFDGVGEITRIHLPLKAATRPGQKDECRGFAYVDFSSPDAKVTAIALSENPLIGRKLLIKDGDDFAGRPAAPAVTGADDDKPTAPKTHSKSAQKILRAQAQPPAQTLFLGNLGFETTETSITQLFNAHRFPRGKEAESDDKEPWIRKVRMGTFEDSGACKGFAFVDFASIEHATSALINIKNHFLDGRKLKVEYASADAVRRGASKPKIQNDDRPRRPFKTRAPRVTEETEGRDEPAAAIVEQEVESDTRTHSERLVKPMRGRGGRDAGSRSRPRPGAALAQAQRQSAAIAAMPSTKKKITF